MLAVVGDPGDHRPLDRRRPKGGEHAAKPGVGLEAAMGEQAVKADRDPEAGEEVDDSEDDQVAGPQGLVPGLPGGDEEQARTGRR